MGIFSGGSFPTSGGTVIITQDGYQTLNLTGNILTISGSNSSVDLSSYLDDTNTTNTSLTLNASNVLTLTDSDSGTVTVDLSSLVTAAGGTAESTHIPVKNTSGATITKGTPVYITGNVGASNRLQIAPADASDPAKMPAIGLLETDLINNAEGYVVQGGYLTNITTNIIDGTSTSSNDTVYVKVGGGITMTKPTGSTNYIQNIAKVARVGSGSSGSLIVSSILRTNDIPNLADGQIWVGSTTYPVSTDFNLQEVTDGGNSTTNDIVLSDSILRLNDHNGNERFTLRRETSPDIQVRLATFNYHLNLESQGTSQGDIIFSTGTSTSLERMRITSAGAVGIGTSSPSAKTHIVGGAAAGGGTALLVENTEGTDLVKVLDSGKFGVNTSSPNYTFHANGVSQLYDAVFWRSGSDNRLDFGLTNEFADGNLTIKNNGLGSNFTFKVNKSDGTDTTFLYYDNPNSKVSITTQLTLNAYTSTNFDGTPTSFLGVDASGNVIKTSSVLTSTPTLQEVTDAGNSTTNKITYNVDGDYLQFNRADGVTDWGKISYEATGLQITGTINNNLILKTRGNGSGEGLKVVDSSNNIQLLVETTTGAIGIGTTSPSAKIDVAGQHLLKDNYDDTGAIFRRNGTYGSVIALGRQGLLDGVTLDYPAQNTLGFSTDGTERMRITDTGLVGINTSSPSYTLEVDGGTNNTIASFVSTDIGSYISFVDDTTTSGEYVQIGAVGNGLAIRTNNTTALTIDTSQNLGIGTSSPSAKIEVSGDGDIIKATRGAYSVVTNMNSGNNNITSTGKGFILQTSDSNPISLYTNGTLGLNINTSQNVGIGTSGQSAKLHIVGADDLFATKGLLVENSSGTDTFFVTNEGIAGFYKHGITNAFHVTGKQTYAGNYSTLVGHQAGGGSSMTGSYQAIFGAYAGDLITGNSTNSTIIGGAAGYQANAPTNSVMVGHHSGSTSDGNNNVFVGYYTRNKYGSNNVMIGRQAGDQSYGGQNVYIGSLAGYAIGASGNNSDNNVFIGYEAGRLTKDGVDRNIFLGYRAGYNTPNLGSGNTVIGDRILENSTEALSNTVVIGAGGNERLRFDSAGQLQLNNYTSTNFDGTPTKILGVDASGNVVKTTRTYQTKASLSFDSVGESTVTLPSTALYGVTATLESSAAEFIVIAQYLAGTSVKFKLYDHTGSAVASVTRTVHYTYTI